MQGDFLLLRTSDLDVESIVNLLDFASPDDIVWFDHGKRKYYSILDDKLGDFFKDYLPDFKPKNGFLIYKGTLLYYYGSISIHPFRYVNGRKQYGRTYRTYCEYETDC